MSLIDTEIENASEEVEYFIKDIKNKIKELMKEGYTFEEASKIIELAIKDINNDVLWRKLKELKNLGYISDDLNNIANNL